MSDKSLQVSKDQTIAPQKLNAADLYALCEQREKKIEAKDYRQILQLLFQGILFRRPLFESEPLAGYKPFDRFNQGLYPYTFSIAQGLSIPRSNAGWRYQKLLENLKKLPTYELRWLLIARWLKQEGVCEPEQFLPDNVLRDLVKKFCERGKLSPTDFRGSLIIHAWLPYFVQLQAELSAKKDLRRARDEVAKLGYDIEAIGYVYRKRSLIQAICAWVGKRKNLAPRTLRNIYSRLYGTQKKLRLVEQ